MPLGRLPNNPGQVLLSGLMSTLPFCQIVSLLDATTLKIQKGVAPTLQVGRNKNKSRIPDISRSDSTSDFDVHI
jgi:hypothetical protein